MDKGKEPVTSAQAILVYEMNAGAHLRSSRRSIGYGHERAIKSCQVDSPISCHATPPVSPNADREKSLLAANFPHVRPSKAFSSSNRSAHCWFESTDCPIKIKLLELIAPKERDPARSGKEGAERHDRVAAAPSKDNQADAY